LLGITLTAADREFLYNTCEQSGKGWVNFTMGLSRFNIILFRYTLFATLLMITYLATTHIHYPVIEDIHDKAGHLLAFYVLALLTDFSFPDSRLNLSKTALVLGYGLLIEIIQYFLPGRLCSVYDLTADALGLMIYWASLPALKYVPLLRRRWKSERYP
jgi:VanZ family protein